MEDIVRKRCAIYTRKSHEDGLEQDFNSLDAQREAGENYIASQKANGWVCLPERYDDGGYSGGNTERPGLKKLLSDAEAGLIDIIVIYKIDRLSRSIVDFAELSKKFEEWHISFVAVTQEINTSTSSGRMMLNILMTFAQYEREVISERIRDKMSASRRKGLFVGGVVPLGYKNQDKKLVVVDSEAKLIRRIFDRYCEIVSPKQVAYELNLEGITTKQGREWKISHIYRLLNNRIYLGEVDYKGHLYKGEHDAIISHETWEKTQNLFKSQSAGKDYKGKTQLLAPLKGILRCGHCDSAMVPTYGIKNKKRYSYYYCSADQKRGASTCLVKSLSAGAIESVVIEQLGGVLRSPSFFCNVARCAGIENNEAYEALRDMGVFWEELFPVERNRLLALLLEKVMVYNDHIELELKINGMKTLLKELSHA